MLKRFFFVTLAAAFAASMGFAGHANAQITIRANQTSATNGRQMYVSYCAPCHGMNAKGDGPVAAELKNQPVDLTMLSENNHGKFPDRHVAAILRFGVTEPAHGNAQMPVWGAVLSNMDTADPTEGQLRIHNLVLYLESTQAK